ncbi:hypothetical protein IC232_12010 [Microvirga sp. BT688]|uniref:hypothetical protein n=1 Tax=Microvirga sp. TaxID=1873136 RepID=UPI00168993C4|nr:hypothetical protein [Microvirga sp.]MBD2747418.1 hypothetical protein [Microvirga sp.]
MRGLGIATLGAVLVSSSVVAGPSKSHCSSGEATVFTCTVGGKTVSLCASADRSFSFGTLQYRFGRIGWVELSYPERPVAPHEAFTGGLALQGGGGYSYVRFIRNGIRYTVYRFIGSGHEEDGLVVKRGEKELLAVTCSNFAHVDNDWWRRIDNDALPAFPDELDVP